MRIRVLLADDHKLFREGLCALLNTQSDIEVVAQAKDGYQVLEMIDKVSPDVAIIDVAMPGMNGIETTRRIIHDYPHLKIIALSMYSDKRLVTGMLSAGASGYLLKDCPFEELAKAIRIVASNHTYLSPMIVNVIVKDYFHTKVDPIITTTLTSREREILQFLAEGKTAKEIASYLRISVKTVDTYRNRIMHKLNMYSIAELTKYAVREGLTPLEK